MPSLSNRLGEISCPVLAMVGEHDANYLPFLPLYQDNIPHCKTVIIPDAGHFPVLENPLRTQHVIGEFLAKVWGEQV